MTNQNLSAAIGVLALTTAQQALQAEIYWIAADGDSFYYGNDGWEYSHVFCLFTDWDHDAQALKVDQTTLQFDKDGNESNEVSITLHFEDPIECANHILKVGRDHWQRCEDNGDFDRPVPFRP